MADELAPLDAWCRDLLTRLEPSQRRTLAREIAKRMRESQAKRIASQTNPDGSPFATRKPRLIRGKMGSIRRQMFAKLRAAKWLKSDASPDSAVVAFTSQVQHIAQVHQFGLRDKVNRRTSNLEVDYPARRLLGFTAAEVSTVEDIVLKHLAG